MEFKEIRTMGTWGTGMYDDMALDIKQE